MFSILRPYIFSLDPEVAHDLAIKSLKANILPKSFFNVESEEMLETNFLGKTVSNPIGLAAGFDKSAEVYNSLFKLGYGFVEVGTITPKRLVSSISSSSTLKKLFGRIFAFKDLIAKSCATSGSKENI